MKPKRCIAVVAHDYSSFCRFCSYKLQSLSFFKRLFNTVVFHRRGVLEIGSDHYVFIRNECDTRGMRFHFAIYWEHFYDIESIKDIAQNIHASLEIHYREIGHNKIHESYFNCE